MAIDFSTKQITQVGNVPIGTPNGIEKDGRGGFIISDVGSGRILQVSSTGDVRVLGQLAPQPADIGIVTGRGLLLVPHLGLNRVSAYDLSALLK